MTVPASPAAAVGRRGRLFLVPTPLDFGCDTQLPLSDTLPQATIAAAASLTHWVCENARSARVFLKRIDGLVPLSLPMQAQKITEMPREVHKKGDHTGAAGAVFDARPLLAPAVNGHDIGLLSEAGMPAIADPGSSIVRAAHDLGIDVIALTGPVSILLALAASGLNGQNFAFVGYLPQDASDRARRIRELESLALRTGQTQLFIETPYRNAALLQALLENLQHNTRLSVSSGLTLPGARTISRLVKTWRPHAQGPDKHTPAIFAIGR